MNGRKVIVVAYSSNSDRERRNEVSHKEVVTVEELKAAAEEYSKYYLAFLRADTKEDLGYFPGVVTYLQTGE